MQTKNRFKSLIRMGTRLAIFAAIFMAVLISNVSPAAAAPAKAISGLSVAAQTGTLNAGTAGSATYQLTLTRNSNFPNNGSAVTWTVTGLPTGASATFTALGSWSGSTRLYQMTMNTTAATPAGATNFTVQAVGPFGAFGGSASAGGLLTVNVSQVSQTITFGALAAKTFGDADFNVSATASSGLPVSFAASGSCTVAGTLVSLTGAGSCAITASQAGNASYFPAPDVPQTFAIAPGNQTITFGTLADMSMGDPDFALGATASSGLPVSYAASGDCTVTGDMVHLDNVGTCTITASQAGDANYNAAVDVAQTFAIAIGDQTITFDPLADMAFGDPDFTLSATASSGLAVSYAAAGDCTVTGDLVSLTGAGSCTITASQSGDANFNPAVDVPQTFAIAMGDQTITFDPLVDKVVGDADFTVSATASSGLPVSFAAAGSCTVAGNLVSLTGAGSCTITASQAGDTNFNPAADVDQSFTVYAVGFDLYAVSGLTTLPGGGTVTVWGYNTVNAPVSQSGGPVLVVNESDEVLIRLHNELTTDTGLLLQGQAMIPDTTGVAAGGTKSYTFTASRAGTYLYGAGLLPNAQYQTAMGLYGALIVRPAATTVSGTNDAVSGTDYATAVLADSPLNYYRLGESTGSTAFDEVVLGNDGTYGTAVSLAVPGLLLNSSNTAAGFDGTSATSFVDTGVTTSLGGAFSVEAWVNANTIGTVGRRIVVKDEVGVTGEWLLWFNAGALRFQVRNSTDTAWVIAEAPTTPLAGATFHVVGVFDGTDVVLYVDGAEVARTPLGTPTTNSNSLPITIGADSDPINPRDQIFDGTIDEVAIYGFALTGTQVQAHFNSASAPLGMTLTDSTATFTGNLVGSTLNNVTDGSSCTVAAFTATTLTCAAPLSGGVDNTWSIGDAYAVGANQAYDSATTAYDDEAVLVLSEIDTALNNSANPAAFDMRKYAPQYFLINGKAYPDTAVIPTAAGNRVLLRYLNAGIQFHSMALLGMHQTVIANDGSPLTFSHRMVAETIGPGQTVDTIATIPTAAEDGTLFAIYDGNLLLHNSNLAGFGGMLTFLSVSGTPPTGDTTGPVTSNVAYGAGTLTATINDTSTGGSTIAAAEYYLDSIASTAIPMNATDGTFDSVSEGVTIAVALPVGAHTLYVRGQDSLGNWGAFSSVLVNGGDASGPATTGLTLTPNPSNGTVNVALHATGNDSASGGSNIAAAEYTIDGGTAVSMAVNLPATIASLDATISAATINGLTEGPHVIAVRSQDAQGNWGAAATINLVVDKTGPTTSSVLASPNPNNGQQGINVTTPAVRMTATFTDSTANISTAEGFIDTVGANGTGFIFIASDSLYNSPVETGYSDIPLTTIIQLSDGNHTLYVHSKDAAGNWGPTSSVVLVIDKTAPAISSITTLDANPTTAATMQFLVTFSESVTGVTSGNFALVSSANVVGAAITSVSGSGATWTVTVNRGSGSGTLGLNLTSATGIKDLAGNALPTAGLPFVGQVYTIPSLVQLYFSTATDFNVPGVVGSADDADIYTWSGGGNFDRLFDGSAAGLAGSANIDAFSVVDDDTFYMSFAGNTAVPGLGGVAAEDIVLYDAGVWSLYFDGSDVGLSGNAENVDAFEILTDGSVVVSTAGTPSVTGLSGLASQDLLQCVGTFGPNTACTWSLYFDGSDVALASGSENVDGVAFSAGNIFLSTTGAFTVSGLSGQGEDVFICNVPTTGSNTACTSFSMFFDGSVAGMTNNLDAFDLP